MITPRFEVTQDDTFVLVEIHVPYVKVDDMDYYIIGNEFKFFVRPYFLCLHFSGQLVEDGRERATYDIAQGKVTIHLPKAEHGQHFEGLDMLTRLLTRKKDPTTPIQVVAHGVEEQEEKDKETIDWENQDDVSTALSPTGIEQPHYGFNNQYSGFFADLREEVAEIIDLPDPDQTPEMERRGLREASEEEKFDGDHYACDYVMDEDLQTLLQWKSWWQEAHGAHEARKQNLACMTPAGLVEAAPSSRIPGISEEIVLTDEEQEALCRLPRKEYLINNERAALLTIVDILFAYAFDQRTTEGEGTVESYWTLCALSATLSWFDQFNRVEDLLRALFRRCLAYPLYRHWGLSMCVLSDVVTILRLGRRAILRSLLSVRKTLASSESKYFLNRLYIDDCCVWIQTVNHRTLKDLAKKLRRLQVTKDLTGWPLDDLERMGVRECLAEESREP